MNFRILAALLVTGPLVFAQAPQEQKKPDSTTAPAGQQKPAPERPVIGLGMSPEEILKIIGKPDKIESVDTEVGKGEEWSYRRLSRKWTQQAAATVDLVPSFVGLALPNEGIGVAALPGYRVENIEEYQISSLLFIEGKLAAARQWFEKERRIEN